MRSFVLFALLVGCAHGTGDDGAFDARGDGEDPGPVDAHRDEIGPADARTDTTTSTDTSAPDSTADTSGSADTGAEIDTGAGDTGIVVVDTGTSTGPIKGGPCASGGSGATAFRVKWLGGSSGSTAYPSYEVTGLPDATGFKVGAYGYSIGFTPVFDDASHAGGLRLDSSSFVDVDFSTAGITTIGMATLSIYGRSFSTTASGSFNWQTFDGTGSTPLSSVAVSWPYEWYGPLGYLGSGPIGDVTAVVKPGKTIKLRIKAGGSSGALIVNKIELCLQAT